MGTAAAFLILAITTLDLVNGQVKPTPVPILREINTHNQDGSYTYGYENGDGSYKIESKSPSGEVKGKYGYYDDVGELREIEYGAAKHGFVPVGTGIPAEVSERALFASQAAQQDHTAGEYEDDGKYRPDEYEVPYAYQPEIGAQVPSYNEKHLNYQPQGQALETFPFVETSARGSFPKKQQHRQREYFQPQVYSQYQPQLVMQQYEGQHPHNVNQGHPSSSVSLSSGSYSLSY